MKNAFLLIFIFSCLYVHASDLRPKDVTFSPSGTVIDKKNKKPVTGTIKEYYKGDKVWTEIPFVNGLKSGTERRYFENGKLQVEINHLNNTKNGTTTYYRENGKPIYTLHYVNDNLTEGECNRINGDKKPFSKNELAIFAQGRFAPCE